MTVIISGSSGITSVNGSAAAPSVTGTDTDTGIVYGTNTITLATNGTAGLIQDANQNVGLSTAPTASWASSWKVLQNQGGFIGANGTAVQLVASNAYSDGTNWRYAAAGYSTSYTQFNGAHSWSSAPSGSAAGVITYTGVLAVDKDKTLTLQGGTQSAGTGIAFPATQSASTDANTLDDYEEGSWTPTLNFGGASGVTTYTQRNGTYTKIGNTVTVRGYILIGTKNAAAGAATLTGLPFPIVSSSAHYATAYLYYGIGSWASGAASCYIDNVTSAVQLGQASASGFVSVNQTNFTNSQTDVIFQATYITSS